MSDIKEGDKVLIETEATAITPEWIAVRITFGRHVQNVRVDRSMVRLAEKPAKAK